MWCILKVVFYLLFLNITDLFHSIPQSLCYFITFSCRGRWLLPTLPWIGIFLQYWNPWVVLFLLSAEGWKNWPPLLYEHIPATYDPVTSSLVWAHPRFACCPPSIKAPEPTVDSEDPWWTMKIFLLYMGHRKCWTQVQSLLSPNTNGWRISIFWVYSMMLENKPAFVLYLNCYVKLGNLCV